MSSKAKSAPSLPKPTLNSRKRDQPDTTLILEGPRLRKPSSKLSPTPPAGVTKPTVKTRKKKALEPINEDTIHEDQLADVTKDVDDYADKSSQSSLDLEEELRKGDEIFGASRVPKQVDPDFVTSGSDSDSDLAELDIDEAASKKVPKPPAKLSGKRKASGKKGSQAEDTVIEGWSSIPMSLCM